MTKCTKKYSKDCFNCEEDYLNFKIVITGAGMDMEMLQDFGERQIAIDCEYSKGYLVLELKDKQVKELTQGKLEKISDESIKQGLNGKMIKDYIIKNKDYIKTNIIQPCTILSSYP